MPTYNNKHYFQLFTDNPFVKTESGAEKRELFSVVQSMVGNFLVYCNPYGQPPHYEQSHFRTPTSLRTILPNHLTSELNIIRSNMVINRTCATLQKTHNLHNHPPLKIYLTTSKIKIYTKRTKPIKIFQYPPLPKLMRHSKVKNNKKL